MSGFGYTILGFGSHPSRGPPALSISLNKSIIELNLTGQVQSGHLDSHPLTSGSGQIDVIATAAGGDTSGSGYAYAWTVTELAGDIENVLAVAAAGTQNVARYNSLTLVADSSATPGAQFDLEYELTCTVTDDAGTTAAATCTVLVTVVAL